ncbi:hypothetical protein KADA111694_06110 [Kaistella daneshvariae]
MYDFLNVSSSMNKEKSKLYRKVNTKTFNVRHDYGSDFSKTRHSKKEQRQQVLGSMSAKKDRGLDYTPLYRFLLSKVGKNWDEVYSEAKSRLDKTDEIFWMVALKEEDKKEFVRCGESSYFSGLFVDENGILQLSNADLTAKDMVPFCTCCTHTLNGKLFGTE